MESRARAVRFLSLTSLGPANPTALEPAPNVTDWEYIQASLEGVPVLIHVDALLEGTHEIRSSYRSWTMYLYPNVRFYRNSPQTSGGSGMAGWPSIGMKETVTVTMEGEKYSAEIEFV
jgi:hypothetical protein